MASSIMNNELDEDFLILFPYEYGLRGVYSFMIETREKAIK